jgi:hypothetical protein
MGAKKCGSSQNSHELGKIDESMAVGKEIWKAGRPLLLNGFPTPRGEGKESTENSRTGRAIRIRGQCHIEVLFLEHVGQMLRSTVPISIMAVGTPGRIERKRTGHFTGDHHRGACRPGVIAG